MSNSRETCWATLFVLRCLLVGWLVFWGANCQLCGLHFAGVQEDGIKDVASAAEKDDAKFGELAEVLNASAELFRNDCKFACDFEYMASESDSSTIPNSNAFVITGRMARNERGFVCEAVESSGEVIFQLIVWDDIQFLYSSEGNACQLSPLDEATGHGFSHDVIAFSPWYWMGGKDGVVYRPFAGIEGLEPTDVRRIASSDEKKAGFELHEVFRIAQYSASIEQRFAVTMYNDVPALKSMVYLESADDGRTFGSTLTLSEYEDLDGCPLAGTLERVLGPLPGGRFRHWKWHVVDGYRDAQPDDFVIVIPDSANRRGLPVQRDGKVDAVVMAKLAQNVRPRVESFDLDGDGSITPQHTTQERSGGTAGFLASPGNPVSDSQAGSSQKLILWFVVLGIAAILTVGTLLLLRRIRGARLEVWLPLGFGLLTAVGCGDSNTTVSEFMSDSGGKSQSDEEFFGTYATQPPVEVKPIDSWFQRHDFGNVFVAAENNKDVAEISHCFQFKNVTTELLSLGSPKVSCACLRAVASSKSVKPGETIEITLSTTPRIRLEQATYSASYDTGKGKQILLYVSFVSVPNVFFEPLNAVSKRVSRPEDLLVEGSFCWSTPSGADENGVVQAGKVAGLDVQLGTIERGIVKGVTQNPLDNLIFRVPFMITLAKDANVLPGKVAAFQIPFWYSTGDKQFSVDRTATFELNVRIATPVQSRPAAFFIPRNGLGVKKVTIASRVDETAQFVDVNGRRYPVDDIVEVEVHDDSTEISFDVHRFFELEGLPESGSIQLLIGFESFAIPIKIVILP